MSSFAGPSVTGTGSTSSMTNIGDIFGGGKIGGLSGGLGGQSLQDLLKNRNGGKILAVELGTKDGIVKFQTAEAKLITTTAQTEFQIRTWQAPESKVVTIPELQNALQGSRQLRNWQQLSIK